MILCCKLEICQCNSDERCANYKNDENNKKHTIYCIYVVTPHSSKYIVQFYLYIDGTKRKESCHCHLRLVPRHHAKSGISLGCLLVWHGAWNSVMLLLPATLPNMSKGEVTNAHISRITRMVPNGRAAVALYVIETVFRKKKVKNKGPQNKQPVNNKFLTCSQIEAKIINPCRLPVVWLENNAEATSYPISPFELHIEGARCVTSDTRSQSIDDNKSCVKGSPIVWVEHNNKCKKEDEHCTSHETKVADDINRNQH